MDIQKAEKLVWKEILQENKENFTPEFQDKVLEIIKKIRKL